MTHTHRWALEPCPESHGGELYTERLTRSTIEGVCACGATRTFHPLTHA